MHARKRPELVLAAALLLVGSGGGMPSPAHAQDEGAREHYETTLKGVQWRESLIRNVSGEFVHTRWTDGTPSEHKPIVYMVRFLIADERSRFSATCLQSGTNPWEIQPGVTGPFFGLPGIDGQVQTDWPRSDVVRDGERELIYSSWLGQGRAQPQTLGCPATKWPPFCDFLLFGNSGFTASELMDLGRNAGRCRYVGTEEALGMRTHVVVSGVPSRDGEWLCRFWVCEEKGWAVVQSEHCLVSGATGRVGQVDLWIGREFRQVAERTWLPFVTEGYKFLYDGNGQSPQVSTTLVSFSRLSANAELSDGAFRYEFPPGTLVTDGVTGELSTEFGPHGRDALRRFGGAQRSEPPGRYNVPDFQPGSTAVP